VPCRRASGPSAGHHPRRRHARTARRGADQRGEALQQTKSCTEARERRLTGAHHMAASSDAGDSTFFVGLALAAAAVTLRCWRAAARRARRAFPKRVTAIVASLEVIRVVRYFDPIFDFDRARRRAWVRGSPVCRHLACCNPSNYGILTLQTTFGERGYRLQPSLRTKGASHRSQQRAAGQPPFCCRRCRLALFPAAAPSSHSGLQVRAQGLQLDPPKQLRVQLEFDSSKLDSNSREPRVGLD